MPEGANAVQLENLKAYTDLYNYVEAYKAVYIDGNNTPNNSTLRGKILGTLTDVDKTEFIGLRTKGSRAFHQFVLKHPHLFGLGSVSSERDLVILARNADAIGGRSMPTEEQINAARQQYLRDSENAKFNSERVRDDLKEQLGEAKGARTVSRFKRLGKTLLAVLGLVGLVALTGGLGAALYGVLATSLGTTLGIASGASIIGIVGGIAAGVPLVKGITKQFKKIGETWTKESEAVKADNARVKDLSKQYKKAKSDAKTNNRRYEADLEYDRSGEYGRGVTAFSSDLDAEIESLYGPGAMSTLESMSMPSIEALDRGYEERNREGGRGFASEAEAVSYVKRILSEQSSEDLFSGMTVPDEQKERVINRWATEYVAAHTPRIVEISIDDMPMPSIPAIDIAYNSINRDGGMGFASSEVAVEFVRGMLNDYPSSELFPERTVSNEDRARVINRWANEYVTTHTPRIVAGVEAEDFDDVLDEELGDEEAFDIDAVGMPIILNNLIDGFVGTYATEAEAETAVRGIILGSGADFNGIAGKELSTEEFVALTNRWANEYVGANWDSLKSSAPEVEVESEYDIWSDVEMNSDTRREIAHALGDTKFDNRADAARAVRRIVNGLDDEILFSHVPGVREEDKANMKEHWANEFVSQNWDFIKRLDLDLERVVMPADLFPRIDIIIAPRAGKFENKPGAEFAVKEIIDSMGIDFNALGGIGLSETQKDKIIRKWASAYVEATWEKLKTPEVRIERDKPENVNPKAVVIDLNRIPMPAEIKKGLNEYFKKTTVGIDDRAGYEAIVSEQILTMFKDELFPSVLFTEEQKQALAQRWANEYASQTLFKKDLEEEEEVTLELTKAEKIEMLKLGLIPLDNADCSDRDLVAAAMVFDASVLSRASEDIRKDKTFIAQRVQEKPGNAATIIANAHDEVKSDEEFAKKIVSAEPETLEHFEVDTQIEVVTDLVDVKPELIVGLSDEAVSKLADLDNGGREKLLAIYNHNPKIMEYIPVESYVEKNKDADTFFKEMPNIPYYSHETFVKKVDDFNDSIEAGNVEEAMKKTRRLEDIIASNYKEVEPEDVKRLAEAEKAVMKAQDSPEHIAKIINQINALKGEFEEALADGRFDVAQQKFVKIEELRSKQLYTEGLKQVNGDEIKDMRNRLQEAMEHTSEEVAFTEARLLSGESKIRAAIENADYATADKAFVEFQRDVTMLPDDKQPNYVGIINELNEKLAALFEKNRAESATSGAAYDFADADRVIFDIREELTAGSLDKAIELYNGASEYLKTNKNSEYRDRLERAADLIERAVAEQEKKPEEGVKNVPTAEDFANQEKTIRYLIDNKKYDEANKEIYVYEELIDSLPEEQRNPFLEKKDAFVREILEKNGMLEEEVSVENAVEFENQEKTIRYLIDNEKYDEANKEIYVYEELIDSLPEEQRTPFLEKKDAFVREILEKNGMLEEEVSDENSFVNQFNIPANAWERIDLQTDKVMTAEQGSSAETVKEFISSKLAEFVNEEYLKSQFPEADFSNLTQEDLNVLINNWTEQFMKDKYSELLNSGEDEKEQNHPEGGDNPPVGGGNNPPEGEVEVVNEPAGPSLEELEIMLYNKMGDAMYNITGVEASKDPNFTVEGYLLEMEEGIEALNDLFAKETSETERTKIQAEIEKMTAQREELSRLSQISDMLIQKITRETFSNAGERFKLMGKVPKNVALSSDLPLPELEALYVGFLEREISKYVPEGQTVKEAVKGMDKRKTETKTLINNGIMYDVMTADYSLDADHARELDEKIDLMNKAIKNGDYVLANNILYSFEEIVDKLPPEQAKKRKAQVKRFIDKINKKVTAENGTKEPSIEELEIMLYNKMGEEIHKLVREDAEFAFENGEEFDMEIFMADLENEIGTLKAGLERASSPQEKAQIQKELEETIAQRDALVRYSNISDLLLQKITKEKFSNDAERLALIGKVPKNVSFTSDLSIEELEGQYIGRLEREIAKFVPEGKTVEETLATMDKRKVETKTLSNNNIMLTVMKADFSQAPEASAEEVVDPRIAKVDEEIKAIEAQIEELKKKENTEEIKAQIYDLQTKLTSLKNKKFEIKQEIQSGKTNI